MAQADKPGDGKKDLPGQIQQQEICGYIFDLLGSLEAIARQHDLPVLAQLIAKAKKEAGECR